MALLFNSRTVGHEPDHPEVLDTRGTLNLTSLAKKFDASGYLSNVSDIVALMTLVPQTRMTHLMIRVGWEVRVAEYDRNADPAPRARFEADLQSLIDYILPALAKAAQRIRAKLGESLRSIQKLSASRLAGHHQFD